MFYYGALIEKDEDNYYCVSFRDIPEALTCGDSFKEAQINARDALITSLEFYYEKRMLIPLPSKVLKEETPIRLSLTISAKIILINEMINKRVTNSELAKLLYKNPSDITKLVSFHCKSNIDSIDTALMKLGKQLNFNVKRYFS